MVPKDNYIAMLLYGNYGGLQIKMQLPLRGALRGCLLHTTERRLKINGI